MYDIFKPYETLYVDSSKVYGKINTANTNEKMLQELPQGGGFSKLPFYCYAYDSIYSKALRLNELVYAPDNSIIRGTVIDYGDWVKHYASPSANMVIRNCIGDIDIVSSDNYINNIGDFEPLDIDFTQVRLGMRYFGFNKTTKQGFDVQSTKELIENFNTGDYVVTETKCNIMYSGYSYNGNGQSEISINFNVGDKWVFANHPLEWSQQGLQLVPAWSVKILQSETSSSPAFYATDGTAVLHGLGIEEVKILPEEEFHDLENGCLLYRYQTYSDGGRYKPVLTVEQCLKEVAFLGVSVCDYGNVNNLYMGYINSDGLATGELIPYSDWGKSDSLNIKHNTMSDYNESLDIKPKPLPEDVDDIYPVDYGYFTNTTIGNLYALKNKLDLEKITQWLLTQTGKIDVAKNIVSLKEIPFPLSRLDISPTDTPIYIGGEKVTYNGEDVTAGQIIGSQYPTLDIVFADFNIPRLSNTFLDYSPYTKYELLLPFAPTPVILPDWCAGKNVKAIFLYDIYTTSCQYVVTCNNERICSVSGNFGIDKPLIAQNVALKDASRLSAQIGTASSVLGGVMSAAVGNVGGVISGAIGGVSSLSQMILSGKNNYMYAVGSNGDSTTVGLYHAAHLKITRTLSAETDGYLHTYGKPLCKMKKLSEIHGFTKCENVSTDGLTCSETEKQMIKQLLENGIYI